MDCLKISLPDTLRQICRCCLGVWSSVSFLILMCYFPGVFCLEKREPRTHQLPTGDQQIQIDDYGGTGEIVSVKVSLRLAEERCRF